MTPTAETPVPDDATTQLPGFTPTPVPPSPAVASAPQIVGAPQPWLPDWWPWAAGLFGALLAGGLGGWLIARRKAARPAPRIERPVAAPMAVDPMSARQPAVPVLSLEVERLMRSLMMLTLNYRLTIANRSDLPLRAVSIAADLISSSRQLPAEQQLTAQKTVLPPASAIERIGPHQSTVISGTLQLPLTAVEAFRQGELLLCAPLLRLRVECDGIEPVLRTYLIGLGSAQATGRVHPLPLTGPPVGYDNVRARELGTGLG